MFKNKNSINDIIFDMQKHLVNNAKNQKSNEFNKLEKAAEYLGNASEIFDEIGLGKYSEAVISLIQCLATPDMSDEEMVKNLEEHGWVFRQPGKNDEVNPEAVKVKIDLVSGHKKHDKEDCGDMSYAEDKGKEDVSFEDEE